jgi:hypothetical protein
MKPHFFIILSPSACSFASLTPATRGWRITWLKTLLFDVPIIQNKTLIGAAEIGALLRQNLAAYTKTISDAFISLRSIEPCPQSVTPLFLLCDTAQIRCIHLLADSSEDELLSHSVLYRTPCLSAPHLPPPLVTVARIQKIALILAALALLLASTYAISYWAPPPQHSADTTLTAKPAPRPFSQKQRRTLWTLLAGLQALESKAFDIRMRIQKRSWTITGRTTNQGVIQAFTTQLQKQVTRPLTVKIKKEPGMPDSFTFRYKGSI